MIAYSAIMLPTYSKLTALTPDVMHRSDKINKGKEWKEQIKPFNFYNVRF